MNKNICYPFSWQRYPYAFSDEQKGLLSSQLDSDFWDRFTFFKAAVTLFKAVFGIVMHTWTFFLTYHVKEA
jgi:hypothetical protein